MKKMLCVALACVLLGACASVGTEIRTDDLSWIVKGRTNISQVRAKYGPPTTITNGPNGRTSYAYVFSRATTKPATFIPVVGLFVGGVDSEGSTVIFTCAPDGTITDYVASQTSLNVRRGY